MITLGRTKQDTLKRLLHRAITKGYITSEDETEKEYGVYGNLFVYIPRKYGTGTMIVTILYDMETNMYAAIPGKHGK